MATYKVGDVVDGFEFTGGDQKDKANWKDWGHGARALPDGSIVRDGPRGGLQYIRKATTGEGGGRLRDFEVTAAGRAVLMDEGQREYEKARKEGYDPSHWKNQTASFLEPVPLVGTWAADVVRDKPSERGRVAEIQFTDGAVRTTSGAGVKDSELRSASRAYFRQPGESPGVERGKQIIRDRFRNSAVKAAGPAYIPRTPEQEQSQRGPAPDAARAAYKKRFNAGMDPKAPIGSETNPFLARDMDTLGRLPKGSYAVAPNGDFGIIE